MDSGRHLQSVRAHTVGQCWLDSIRCVLDHGEHYHDEDVGLLEVLGLAVEILKPETATSYEAGVPGRHLCDRVWWQLAAFQMVFENLVKGAVSNGLPILIHGGNERFAG